MQFFVRRPWDLPQRRHTAPEIFANQRQHRREFLRSLGIGAAGAALSLNFSGCARPTDEEIEKAGAPDAVPTVRPGVFPAHRNAKFEYGRDETPRRAAAEFTNFYEFSGGKDNWRHVAQFKPSPWTLEVGGLCAKPRRFNLDDLFKLFALEERAYRHRCVETWAMCIPWTGFALRDLLKLVEPRHEAQYVVFETFERHDEAAGFDRAPNLPWPYTEGLTIAEASNELAFLALGIYGEPLPKQHGAPVRLAVPWKYGFKSAKSLVRITCAAARPATFWNTVAPHEYGFEANVDPEVAHPRWSQRTEWMLGSRERFTTVKYNGYGDSVAKLYSA
jgi:sulfoxide reductase catalytic subunit YedY